MTSMLTTKGEIQSRNYDLQTIVMMMTVMVMMTTMMTTTMTVMTMTMTTRSSNHLLYHLGPTRYVYIADDRCIISSISLTCVHIAYDRCINLPIYLPRTLCAPQSTHNGFKSLDKSAASRLLPNSPRPKLLVPLWIPH